MIKVQKGDVVLVHSNGIVAKVIHIGMNLKSWLDFDFRWKKVKNHGAFALDDNKIIEAISKVVTIHDINEAYSNNKNTEIDVYRFDWREDQLKAIDIIALELEGKHYQYSNFLSWAVNILTLGKVWIGKTGEAAKETQYCTETVGTILYSINQGNYPRDEVVRKKFEKFWKTSPNKLEGFCKQYGKHVAKYILD